VRRARDYGIAAGDIVIDPLAMPDGVPGSAGSAIFPLIRRLCSELGVNTICGASNVSFGRPHRARTNARFLARAMACGLAAAILNPMSAPEMAAARRGAASRPRVFPLGAETG
jgi:5-methyltetrahydrofolate--homocysteine methyltransferase